jgi:hypothetical protein
MKWISENCPLIAKLFTSWCDVQELAAEDYSSFITGKELVTPRTSHRALDKTMTAMGISGWRSRHQRHGAAADAVRILAILSGLLCGATLRELPESYSSVSVLCTLPSTKDIRFFRRRHHYTARIRAADGDKLPLQTPNGQRSYALDIRV